MNNYQIYEEIGHGRNSVVRKGRRKNTIEYYAIASYEKSQRSRVNTSVQFLRTLSHSNILKFYNWYETGNHLWVITELCTGGNLRTILTEESKLPENSIRVLAADIAKGLVYLHSRGVLYVELKPSNLLLDATGQLRFYDFGLAIVFSHADKAGRVGAPSFMAPERFEEGAVPSTASDLWGFGCILYEMASGKPPFDGASTKDLISNIVSKPHEPLQGMSAEFTRLVDNLLQKDPAERATWADVVGSEVFEGFTAPDQFPKQPHFEAYLKQREAPTERNTVSRETKKREHDVLRASINAERNLNRAKGIRPDQSSATENGQYLNAANSGTASRRPSSKKGQEGEHTATPPAEAEAKKESFANAGITLMLAIDERLAVAKSTSKADLDFEMDFRDPEVIEKEVTEAAAADGPPSVSPPPAAGGSDLVQEPPTVSPPSSAPLPQTPNVEQSAATRAPNQAAEVIAVEDLLNHPQDAHLRPLVANNRIEKYAEPKVDLAQLQAATGLTPLPALQLRDLSKEKKEAFITSVQDLVALTNTKVAINEKLAVITYFETLCTDAQVAEMVVNSSLMSLFSQLLLSVSSTPPQFRLGVATVMGLLVRHSNFIDDSMHVTSLIPSLLQSFRAETNGRVKRRVLSCVGELLFYITSRPPAQRLEWRVDGNALAEIYGSALGDQDEVLVHYAAKMIENTCSVSDVTAAVLFKFTSAQIVTSLLTRYDAFSVTKGASEHLRVALACAPLKLCLVDHSLFPTVLGWPSMEPATFLNEIANPQSCRHNSKVIQSYLTVIAALYAKTITLNGAICGRFTKHLNWAKRDGNSSNSVFSAASCASVSHYFSDDSPITTKIRQTIATLAPRIMKKVLLAHASSPIRAKSCLLLALMSISDECGLTAPPSQMLMQTFAADRPTTSLRTVIAQLSRDTADPQVQRSAGLVVAVGQIAAVLAIQNLATPGRTLLPPPASNDAATTAVFLEFAYHVLSATLSINVSSAYEPLQFLSTLAKVLHRAASDPDTYAIHTEIVLRLVEAATSRAIREAEVQGQAAAGRAAVPIVGDDPSAVISHQQRSTVVVSAKVKEVAKVTTSAILPALIPTLEGAIARAVADATGAYTTTQPSNIPAALAPSPPADAPYVLMKFINDHLVPIVSDPIVCSGDVGNNIFVFGRELVRLVPSLLSMKHASPPTIVPNTSFGKDANNGSVMSPLATEAQSQATSHGMLVTMTLKVLSLLSDTCPGLTNEVRTTNLVDQLMSFLKVPALQMNNHALQLLLRLLKAAPAETQVVANASTSNSRIGAVASAHNTFTAIDLTLMKYCVTKHHLLQWAMQSATKSLPDWDTLEDIITALMEIVFLVVYSAAQNTSSEMAMVCGHLVAGADTTPVESLLLKICVQHPSAVSAADCASSCVFLLVGLFEEARKLLVRPRVLTQIREVLNQTCFVESDLEAEAKLISKSTNRSFAADAGVSQRAIYPHVATPLLQSLVVLARVTGPAELHCDELLLMQIQKIADTCPNAQLVTLSKELVGYLFQ